MRSPSIRMPLPKKLAERWKSACGKGPSHVPSTSHFSVHSTAEPWRTHRVLWPRSREAAHASLGRSGSTTGAILIKVSALETTVADVSIRASHSTTLPQDSSYFRGALPVVSGMSGQRVVGAGLPGQGEQAVTKGDLDGLA